MRRDATAHGRSKKNGFTLIEVVVALAVLALSLGALYESFGWSLRRTAALERREGAWLTAQSLLAEIRGRPQLRPGTEPGESTGGLKWVSHIAQHDASSIVQGSLAVFDVTIEVSWGGGSGHSIRLQSMELSRTAS